VTQRYLFTRWRIVAALAAISIGTVALAVSGAQEFLEPDLPDVAALRDVRLQVPLLIYTRDGRLMGQFGETRRIPLTVDQIPQQLIQAVLAAEDDRFFEHKGVDYPGLARAIVRHLLSGRKAEGGSTITMQLTRGVFLSPEKSYRRKLAEIFLTLRIERQFSKDEILTLYLNKSFLGQRAYGIGAAAEVYFGKTINELTIPEIALIAGTFRSPSRDNPVASPELARQRRAYVLRRMREKNFISQAEYDAALEANVESKLHDPAIEVEAPYVAEMVRVDLLNRIGPKVFTDGYVVTTTLDSRLQRAAVDAVRAGLIEYDQRRGYRGPAARVTLAADATEKEWREILDDHPSRGGLQAALVLSVGDQSVVAYERDHGQVTISLAAMKWARPAQADGSLGRPIDKPSAVVQVGDVVYIAQDSTNAWHLLQIPIAQSAFVALDPHDGAVSALVGGFDYNASNFNRAVQAKRQPGSSFKPLLYSAALEHGYTPATLINDAPIVFEDAALEGAWRPQNINRASLGPIRMREALIRSLNQVSIRIMHALGPAYVIDHAQRFGLSTDEFPHDLSIGLGTMQVSPLRLANAYAVFANGGFLTDPYYVDRIQDSSGSTIYAAHPKYACADCPYRDRSEAPVGDETEGNVAEDSSVTGDKAPRTLSPQNAYLMTDMLMDVVRRGTATRALELKRFDLAGKTGTSQDLRDTWFCGFNADIVGVAWVGFDQERSLGPGEQGGRTALPIWIKFMAEALRGRPDHRLPAPAGLETRLISSQTGKAARPGDPDAVFETFVAGTAPEFAGSEASSPQSSDSQQKDDGDSLF